MCQASRPIANTSLVRLLMAITEGSLRTIPSPRVHQGVGGTEVDGQVACQWVVLSSRRSAGGMGRGCPKCSGLVTEDSCFRGLYRAP